MDGWVEGGLKKGKREQGKKVKRKVETKDGREERKGMVGRKDRRKCGREERNEGRMDGREGKRRNGR